MSFRSKANNTLLVQDQKKSQNDHLTIIPQASTAKDLMADTYFTHNLSTLLTNEAQESLSFAKGMMAERQSKFSTKHVNLFKN